MPYRVGSHGGMLRSASKRRAQLNAKWQRIVQYSIDGLSVDDAAHILGIKVDSLQRLIKIKTGSRTWPISKDFHPFSGKAKSPVLTSSPLDHTSCGM